MLYYKGLTCEDFFGVDRRNKKPTKRTRRFTRYNDEPLFSANTTSVGDGTTDRYKDTMPAVGSQWAQTNQCSSPTNTKPPAAAATPRHLLTPPACDSPNTPGTSSPISRTLQQSAQKRIHSIPHISRKYPLPGA